jgi:hypothetical protein
MLVSHLSTRTTSDREPRRTPHPAPTFSASAQLYSYLGLEERLSRGRRGSLPTFFRHRSGLERRRAALSPRICTCAGKDALRAPGYDVPRLCGVKRSWDRKRRNAGTGSRVVQDPHHVPHGPGDGSESPTPTPTLRSVGPSDAANEKTDGLRTFTVRKRHAHH